jgi:hypothetical protein
VQVASNEGNMLKPPRTSDGLVGFTISGEKSASAPTRSVHT